MLAAIQPGGTGDITESHVNWKLNTGIPEIPSPIFHAGRLYLIRDGGILSCINAETGKVIYRERLLATGQYSSSPVIARDHLYLISNQGIVTVVRTGDTFQVAHQQDLAEPVSATPALDAVTIYLRTESQLYAFRAR